MYFFVFAMYFIVFLYGIVWVLNINQYNSDFNCNESKYCILELKMEFWHKKPFSICFVHKSWKCSNFEPTLDYIMLRNFGTICPIFPKMVPKVAQDFKEKSHESSRCGKKFPRNYRAKRRADSAPPGPFRVKAVTGSIWQLWDLHGCNRVSVVLTVKLTHTPRNSHIYRSGEPSLLPYRPGGKTGSKWLPYSSYRIYVAIMGSTWLLRDVWGTYCKSHHIHPVTATYTL